MNFSQSNVKGRFHEVAQEIALIPTSRPAHEEEPDLQNEFENQNYEMPLLPEEFSNSRAWWYRCRTCGGETRVHTRHPFCRHCGFSPKSVL